MAKGRPLEVQRRPFQTGPVMARVSPGPRQFIGRTTLNSGSAFQTVSTAVVNSDSIFRLATQPSSIGPAGASGGCVVVNSIVSGVSFALARAYGTAAPWNEVVHWEIVRQSV